MNSYLRLSLLACSLIFPLALTAGVQQACGNGQKTTKSARKSAKSSETRQMVTLEGKVTDADDKPISNTKVAALPSCKCSSCPDYPDGCSCCPDGMTVVTDNEGRYTMAVQPGKYTLKANGTTKTVHVPEDGATVDLKVKKSDVQKYKGGAEAPKP